ncbi:uncharacterized protein [Engystomops pustulosus]|uniref:uncharacterized protein n=1 Tax=Engystomops pustulosus TaxID=76066 RepID=UPI003AFB35F6
MIFLVDVVTMGLISVLVSFVVIIFLVKFYKNQKRSINFPPGPMPLPIIGNMHVINTLKPQNSFMELSKKYGPVFSVYLGAQRLVVLCGFDTVKEALINNAEEFAGRPVTPIGIKVSDDHGILLSNGETWKAMRRFTLSTLRDFGMGKKGIEDQIMEECECLLKTFSSYKGKPFNNQTIINAAVANIIVSILMEYRYDYDDPTILKLMNLVNDNIRIMESIMIRLYNSYPSLIGWLPGSHQKISKNNIEMQKFVRDTFTRKEEELDINNPRNLIDAFLAKQQEGKPESTLYFTHKNLGKLVSNLFAAGMETTSTTLRWGLLLMMKYPDIQRKVQDEIENVIGFAQPQVEHRKEMPYTDAVIHEIQRFGDIVPGSIPHATTKDITFRDYFLPKGTIVIPLLHSALRDKDYFEKPEDFYPGHFLDSNGKFKKNEAFIPFSLGKRSCAGENLAKMEIFLFFTTLLQNFTFQAPPGAKLELTPAIGFTNAPLPHEICAIPPQTFQPTLVLVSTGLGLHWSWSPLVLVSTGLGLHWSWSPLVLVSTAECKGSGAAAVTEDSGGGWRVFIQRNTRKDAPLELDRALRALQARPPSTDPPRDVICRVHRYQLKDAIMNKARNLERISFQGTSVQLLPDLSRLTLLKRKALRPLLEVLKQRNIPYTWGFPFKLQIRHGGNKYVICHPDEIPMETHFKTGHYPEIKDRHFTTWFHSSNPESRSKGISIAINRSLPHTVLGEMLDEAGRYAFVKVQIFNQLSKKYGPVFSVYLGAQRLVVLCGFDTVKEALINNAEEFAGRPVTPIGIKVSDDHASFCLWHVPAIRAGSEASTHVPMTLSCALASEPSRTVRSSASGEPGQVRRNVFSKYTLDCVKVLDKESAVSITPHRPLNCETDISPGSILASNGETWKAMRRFTLSTLRDFGMGKKGIEDQIMEECECLLKTFSSYKGKPFNNQTIMNAAVANIIVSILMEYRYDYDDPTILKLMNLVNDNIRIMESIMIRLYNSYPSLIGWLPGSHQKISKNNIEMQKFVRDTFTRKEEELDINNPRNLIDAFLAKQQEGKPESTLHFTHKNLGKLVSNLFAAGMETTSTTLRWGLLLMMKYPDIQRKVQDEIENVIGFAQPQVQHRKEMLYTDAVIHEIQRFGDIVPSVPHATTKDITFRGYFLPKGTIVVLLLHSALRDKDYFEKPEDFYPGHFLDSNGKFKKNEAFIPFSLGKRSCAGENLAKMELFLFFTTLLQNFTFQAPPGEKLDLTPAIGFTNAPLPYEMCAIPRR